MPGNKDLKSNGVGQKELISILDDVEKSIEEFNDDHATFKTAANSHKAVMGDISLTAAGLVIGSGDDTKVKIANTVTFLNAGLFKSKTTAEVAFTATTHDVADGANAFFVLSLDASGTVTITKGADNAALTTITVPAGDTVIGYVNIAASGAIFNASTDALSDGHITDVYTDASYLEHQIGDAPATLTQGDPTVQVTP